MVKKRNKVDAALVEFEAREKAKTYPIEVGNRVVSDVFPDYEGDVVEVLTDGTALVDLDVIGYRLVPLETCVDADLIDNFEKALWNGVDLDSIDVEKIRRENCEENLEIRERILDAQRVENARKNKMAGRYRLN